MDRVLPSSWMKFVQAGLFVMLSLGFFVMIRDRMNTDHWPVGSESWSFSWAFLMVAVLLVPVNWGLEMMKFHALLGDAGTVPRKATCQSVLAGITASMFLPNRMGEFAGRMLFFPADQRPKVVSATMAGSVIQAIWIALIGGSVVLFSDHMGAVRDLVQLSWRSVIITVSCLVAGILIVRMNPTLRRFFQRTIEHFRNILGTAAVTTAGGWALLRYVTYCFQFVLLLYFVGLDQNIGHLFIFVFTIFFLQTILPLPPALGWMTRIQLAVLLGGVMVMQPVQAAAASLLLWLINLLIPGLFGAALLFRKNLYKHLPHARTSYHMH